MPGLYLESLIQCVCGVTDNRHTVPGDSVVGTMASGDSLRRADRSGVSFRVHIQVPWNAPESLVTLDSPGVVVLDTSYVPDVLGLRTHDADAELVRVLQGRAENSVRVLIPDAIAGPAASMTSLLWIWLMRPGRLSPWGIWVDMWHVVKCPAST